MSKYASLDEFFTLIENHYGGWDEYRRRFAQCSPDNRVTELVAFDELLERETAPSRTTAEYIQRRRNLGDIDNLLRRARR
jgi:hypothetical protein